MAARSGDGFRQAEHDLGHAEAAAAEGRFDWACFASHQAAEKAVKALHLHHRQESWGHVVARLLAELPASVAPPPDLIDVAKVLDAGRAWAERLAHADASVVAIGCFGSFARGDDGFGSDLDLVAVVHAHRPEPTDPRWSTLDLPVPADLVVYTADEWRSLVASDRRMARVLAAEARWWIGRPPT